MQSYTATVEVDRRDFQTVTATELDRLVDALAPFHPAVHESPRGYLAATVTLPGATLAQATAAVIPVVENALRAPVVAVEAMPAREFDQRNGFVPLPELISVTEAAELLGVSRQAVLQRIGSRSLPATRVGRDWVLPRAAVEASAG